MHFYNLDGSSCYEIKGKNGKMRTPYIKEAKALGLAPGVTSISGQLGNEGITQWAISMAVDICKQNPFCSMGTSEEAWTKKIRTLIKKESDRITGQGHAIHDALETYYKTGQILTGYASYIRPVIDLIAKEWPILKRTDWIAEKRFNYKGLYGGSVDLHTEYGNGIILDFKTKDTVDMLKFKAYEGHKQQLVAYANGLEIPKAKCGNIFLSALMPNVTKLDMHDDLNEHWEKFKLLVKYWHKDNFNQEVHP